MLLEPTTNQKNSHSPCMNSKSLVCLSCAVCKGRHCDLQAPVDNSQDMGEVKDMPCCRGVGAFEIASLSINSVSNCWD